jgi:hypothetical protein
MTRERWCAFALVPGKMTSSYILNGKRFYSKKTGRMLTCATRIDVVADCISECLLVNHQIVQNKERRLA